MTHNSSGPKGMRVLVTGFGPFPGAAFNSSAWLIERLLAHPPELPAGASLYGGVLETSWKTAGRDLESMLEEITPGIAIHFGLDQTSPRFRVETRAQNRAARAPDCTGAYFGGTRIISGAPHILKTPLPHWPIVYRLKNRLIPVAVSHDAGQYICNYCYYLSLWNARRANPSRLTCFVHIPQLSAPPARRIGRRAPYGQTAVPADDLILGAHEIITAAIHVFRGRFSRSGSADPE